MWDFNFGGNDSSSDNEDFRRRPKLAKPRVGIQNDEVESPARKFIPGGKITYSRFPAKPKVWEELQKRGIKTEMRLGNTGKTIIPDVISDKSEDIGAVKSPKNRKALPPRHTGKFISSGSLSLFYSRLEKTGNMSALSCHEEISGGFLRGMANSSFYAGDFEYACRYLKDLSERKTLKCDTKLLLLECFAYQGGGDDILKNIGEFDEAIKDCSSKNKIIPLFHLMRWALELRHNNRHYAVIFVCRATCWSLQMLEGREHRFYLTYAMFVEIVMRVLSVIVEDSDINTVLIDCMEEVLEIIFNRSNDLQRHGSSRHWKVVVTCCNAIAFICNIAGMYDRAMRNVEDGLKVFDLKLNNDAVIYPDLMVNLGMAFFGKGNLKEAKRWYEKAIELYRSCETQRKNFEKAEMIEKANNAVDTIKQMWDAQGIFDTPKHNSGCEKKVRFES